MTPLRLGCDIPFLADPRDVREFAVAVEDLGFDTLSWSEHVASTVDSPFPAGFSHEDPWHEAMTFAAFLAGVTTRIQLSTSMMLLALRPAVLAAKQVAEVDLLSGGRLRLGVSLGWNDREVAALGVDPRTRGARLEEQLTVMRLLWTEDPVTFSGGFHQLDGVGIHPRPARSVPIWMGAGSFASRGVPSDKTLHRIARSADGYKMFAPAGADLALATKVIQRLHGILAAEGRDPAAFGIEARLLTQQTPEAEWPERVAAYAELGVSDIGLGNRIVGGTVADQIAHLRHVMTALRPLL